MVNEQVVLSWFEIAMAADVAIRRRVEAIRLKSNTLEWTGDAWSVDIEAAAGELAVAKALNRYWDGSVNTFQRAGDVGHLQVRSAPKESHSLIVRERDKDTDVFILVTGKIPAFRIRGWIMGRHAKRAEWRRNPSGHEPAYFVPPSSLQSIENLMPAPFTEDGRE
jgi:hypothetical protein